MEGAPLGNYSINNLNTAVLVCKCHNYLERDLNKKTISMVFIKKQNKLINKNHILHSETHTPGIKIKALSLHMLNKKIFLNRQISRTLVTQPNQQFALLKTSTDALKKIISRASQVQRPETNTLCKFQTDRNQSSSFVRSDKPVSIYTCVRTSLLTQLCHRVSLPTFSYRHGIWKSPCKLRDGTLV